MQSYRRHGRRLGCGADGVRTREVDSDQTTGTGIALHGDFSQHLLTVAVVNLQHLVCAPLSYPATIQRCRSACWCEHSEDRIEYESHTSKIRPRDRHTQNVHTGPVCQNVETFARMTAVRPRTDTVLPRRPWGTERIALIITSLIFTIRPPLRCAQRLSLVSTLARMGLRAHWVGSGLS